MSRGVEVILFPRAGGLQPRGGRAPHTEPERRHEGVPSRPLHPPAHQDEELQEVQHHHQGQHVMELCSSGTWTYHACTYMHMHVLACTCMYLQSMHTFIYIHVHASTCMYIHVPTKHVYMHVHPCTCMYLHVHACTMFMLISSMT